MICVMDKDRLPSLWSSNLTDIEHILWSRGTYNRCYELQEEQDDVHHALISRGASHTGQRRFSVSSFHLISSNLVSSE
jgi:hypothetical protein